MTLSRKNKHLLSYESLVTWGCICGKTWMNEFLKGKSDEELIAERELSFRRHILRSRDVEP